MSPRDSRPWPTLRLLVWVALLNVVSSAVLNCYQYRVYSLLQSQSLRLQGDIGHYLKEAWESYWLCIFGTYSLSLYTYINTMRFIIWNWFSQLWTLTSPKIFRVSGTLSPRRANGVVLVHRPAGSRPRKNQCFSLSLRARSYVPACKLEESSNQNPTILASCSWTSTL